MKTLKQYKDKQMGDDVFVKEYEAIQPEMDVVRDTVKELDECAVNNQAE